MSQTLTAIYSNGVLRPLVALDLAENSEVELDLKVIRKTQNPRSKIAELLIKKGLSIEIHQIKNSNKLSKKERERLAKVFSSPQQIGELINEDREER